MDSATKDQLETIRKAPIDFRNAQILENLSKTDEKTVRKKLIKGGATVAVSSFVFLSPSYLYSSFPFFNGIKKPLDIAAKTTALPALLYGAREFTSALHEEYQILRGSRLPEEQRTFLRGICNGVMDVVLASSIHAAQHYLPKFLSDTYKEAYGPEASDLLIHFLVLRGVMHIVVYTPQWVAEQDWDLNIKYIKEKATSASSTFLSLFLKKTSVPSS